LLELGDGPCAGGSIAALTVRVILAVVFCAAALGKIRQPRRGSDEFLRVVGLGRLAGRPITILAYAEAGLGVALLAGVPGAVTAATVALGVFAGMHGVAILRGYDGSCGCFGGHEPGTGRPPLVRTGLLFGLALGFGFTGCMPQPVWLAPATLPAVALLTVAAMCCWITLASSGRLRASAGVVDRRIKEVV
jgi:uncharacterized membrane protein YphA (DoxX/SURF4 family)